MRRVGAGDIKAANLFVFRNFRLKLYHFGLSREQLSSARRRDAQAGTMHSFRLQHLPLSALLSIVRDLLELIKEDMVLFALCAASIIARKVRTAP